MFRSVDFSGLQSQPRRAGRSIRLRCAAPPEKSRWKRTPSLSTTPIAAGNS